MSRGFLLDTCALSALAPGKVVAQSEMAHWLRQHSDRLFISAVTVAEIEQGICKRRRTGGVERAARLAYWVDDLLSQGSDRILAFGTDAARIAGRLSDGATSAGRHPGFPDVAIAATAMAHGLVVVTQNIRQFAALGVEFLDLSTVNGKPGPPVDQPGQEPCQRPSTG